MKKTTLLTLMLVLTAGYVKSQCIPGTVIFNNETSDILKVGVKATVPPQTPNNCPVAFTTNDDCVMPSGSVVIPIAMGSYVYQVGCYNLVGPDCTPPHIGVAGAGARCADEVFSSWNPACITAPGCSDYTFTFDGYGIGCATITVE